MTKLFGKDYSSQGVPFAVRGGTPEDFDAVGDGVADDTDAVVAWAAAIGDMVILLPPGKTYLCASLVSGAHTLDFAAGAKVYGNGSQIRFSETDASNTLRGTIGAGTKLDSLVFYWTGANYFQRFLDVNGDGAKLYDVTFESELEQPAAARDDIRDTTLKFSADNIKTRGLIFKNIFWCADVNPDAMIDNLQMYDTEIRGYGSGITLTTESNANTLIDGLVIGAKNSNAGPDPGRNAITEAGANCTIRDVVIDDAAEHAVYLSGPSAKVSGLTVSNLRVKGCGQCGLKIRNQVDAVLTDIHVGDIHQGSAAGPNEDGLRLELCDNVRVSGFSTNNEGEGGTGGYDGIIIDSCTKVYVDGSMLQGVQNAGIRLIDDSAPGTLDDIRINGITGIDLGYPLVRVETAGAVGKVRITGVQLNTSSDVVYCDAAVAPTDFIVHGFLEYGGSLVNNVSGGGSIVVTPTN